jgi:FtsZ-interacting cell division protein YlmF
MISSIWGRVVNYIMTPIDDIFEPEELRSVHSSPKMKVMVITPDSSEKTCQYADSLQAGTTLIIEYSSVDKQIQQTMHNFLEGVCYVIKGNCQILSENVIMYMPTYVEVTRSVAASSVAARQVYPFDRILPVNRFYTEARSN